MLPKKVISHLSKDPIMATLLEKVTLKDWPKEEITEQYFFSEIVETILGQQLSNKAAATIISRFEAIFNGDFPTPKELLKVSDEEIRKCGTSFSKIRYIKNVANEVLNGDLNLLEMISQPDEKVRERLIKIKGVGPWTVEIILMFTLRRPDIFSIGDVGLLNAMEKWYGLKRSDTKKVLKISEKWSPYRSFASRILWKSLEV